MQEMWVQSLGGEGPLEEGMATHSSIIAWRIPWTEEPGGLQSMESQRVRHELAAKQQAPIRTSTIQRLMTGTSLEVQWSGLRASNTGSVGSVPG